jgi:CheY-like chemotaxis protein
MPNSAIRNGSHLTGIRVLVAEDEPLLLMLLTDLLADLGCLVTGSATQVPLAMRLAKEAHVDLAVLDVNLGDMDIEPLIDLLQARAVPVVLATGYDVREIAKRFPYAKLLSKPYTLESLRCALDTALAPKLDND